MRQMAVPPSQIKGSGILYEDVSEDIERLVSMKASLYKVPGFDREDIAQEIRLVCIKALGRYDASKNNSTPFHYLARVTDNRLKNLLRDNGHSVSRNQREDQKALDRAAKKKKLHTALSVGDDVDESSLGPICAAAVQIMEFREYLFANLPESLHSNFSLLLKSGPPAICPKSLKLIKSTIMGLYSSYFTE